MIKKQAKLMLGDNIESLKKLPDNSIDSIVTDPPYGLSFMGKKWDYDVPSVEFWKEVYRVLKPGGYILSFGGTRTYHRMVVNIEDAGFEIRDQVMWLYGSGFPKSHNIGKAVDKLEGNDREVVSNGVDYGHSKKEDDGSGKYGFSSDYKITKGQSKYEGWGTALKPANEPICVARKPLSEKTIADNVIKWGTGGINIDGCRIGTDEWLGGGGYNNKGTSKKDLDDATSYATKVIEGEFIQPEGRFPANIILECICDKVIKSESTKRKVRGKLNDHKENSIFGIGGAGIENYDYNDSGDIHTNPDCVCYQLDEQSGISKSSCKSGVVEGKDANVFNDGENKTSGHKKKVMVGDYSDKGGASRFFYVAKVSKKERNLGLDGFEDKIIEGRDEGQDERSVAYKKRPIPTKNTHPTLKPINLMTYLCRLITPKGGIVLDPFMGSGSTGISALLEGFRFVGMEMDADYFKIAEARIESYEEYRSLLK